MPLIQILSYSQKKEFETPLVLNNESREEVFSLPPPIERQMVAIDKAINKARFIAMFGYFKVTRSFYEPSMFHENDIDYIARRYDLKIDDISSAKNTIALYKKIIREHFGYMAPDEYLKQKLINESQRLIVGLSTPKAVFYALVESAIGYRYEVPSYTFLSKIITEAMNTALGVESPTISL
jgi:membrane-bound inhibitor of C-type lysozyme